MYCTKCGAELKDGSRFCGYCGVATNEMEVMRSADPDASQGAERSLSSRTIAAIIISISLVIAAFIVGGALFVRSQSDQGTKMVEYESITLQRESETPQHESETSEREDATFQHESEASQRTIMTGTYIGTGINSPHQLYLYMSGNILTTEGQLDEEVDGMSVSSIGDDKRCFILTPDTTYGYLNGEGRFYVSREEFMSHLPSNFPSVVITVQDGYVIDMYVSS